MSQDSSSHGALYPSNYDSLHRTEVRIPAPRHLTLSPTEYARFRAFVLERIGLDFPEDKRAMLGHGLAYVMEMIGCTNLGELYARLNASPTTSTLWDQVISVLTVGETYFFRNTSHFDALAKHILPELIRDRVHGNRRLRIWSAGCASGEEPYSLAILLKETVPHLESWNVLILATDINREALKKAQAGRYGAWSFRGVDRRVQETYFKLDGNQYVIADHIKQMVTFDYLNLVSDAYPSLTNNTNAMDLIVCRNVTIYFNERVTRAVIQKFYQSLVNGGWLIPGSSEPNMLYYDDFEPRNFPGTVVYQKPHTARVKPVFEPFQPFQDTLMPSTSQPSPDTVAPSTNKTSAKPLKPEADPYEQALALMREGNTTAALAQLYAKIDRAPHFAPAYAALGKIYANQGNLGEAQHWCERALRLDKLHPEPYYTLSLVYQQQGLLDLAVDALKKTLYLDREFVLAHYNLAQIYRHQGEHKFARRELENVRRLLQNMPRDAQVPEGDGLLAARLLELVENELALDESS